MNKAYLYKGKKYSNGYWRDFEGNIYDGDIWMLLEALAEDKRTKLEKHIYTFFLLDGEQFTDDSMDADEDLIEDMFEEGYLDNIDIERINTEENIGAGPERDLDEVYSEQEFVDVVGIK